MVDRRIVEIRVQHYLMLYLFTLDLTHQHMHCAAPAEPTSKHYSTPNQQDITATNNIPYMT